jgi:hypothetical protein
VGASKSGRPELAGRMGGDGPTKGKNQFPFYFLTNSNIFTFLSNKNLFSQVGQKIKVI